MTELTQVGLITQIEQLVVPYSQLALRSPGQSGFGMKDGATIAYVHPYLSDSGAEMVAGQGIRGDILPRTNGCKKRGLVHLAQFAAGEYGSFLEQLRERLHNSPAH